jgi:hypothetical protein
MRLGLRHALGGDGSSGREWRLVAAGWLLIVVCTVVWLALDRRPPEWDHANHLERVVDCAKDIEAGDARAIVERSSFYPPLAPCAASLVYRLLPSDAAAAQATMLLFLALGMAATYVLGQAWVDGTAGVAAAWIFGTAPFVVYSVVQFQLDLPLAAMVALAVAVVVRTDGFRSTGWSLVAGVVGALGMLTKPTFATYVLAPVLWVLFRERTRRSLRNAGLAAGVAAALSLPWYGPRLLGLPMQLFNRSVKGAILEGKPETLTADALAYYPRWIFTQLGVLAVILLAVGLILALVKRRGLCVVAFLAPFVLSMLVRNKNLRYTLPVLPMAAVLAGTAVAMVGKRWRPVLAALVIVAGVTQVSETLFAIPPVVRLPIVDVPSAVGTPPMRTDWHHRAILALIARDSAGAPVTVSVVPNYNFFSVSNFRYYAVRDGLPLRFVRAWDDEPVGVEYMILKTGAVGPSWTADKINRAMDRLARDPDLARVYPVLAEFPLPDGSVGSVRVRRVPAGITTPPDGLARALEGALRRQVGEVARDVEGLVVHLIYDGGIARGRVRRVELSATAATVGDLRRRGAATLRLRNLRLVLDDVLVNPFSLEAHGRADLLDAGRFRLERAEVAAADLQVFLHQLKNFRHARVDLVDGALDFTIEQPGPDLAARLRIVPAAGRPFALEVEQVRLGVVPLPGALINWVARHYDPTPELASRLPFPVEIGPVSIAGQTLRIGEAGSSEK